MQCPQRDSDSADIDIFWRMTQKRISRIPTWQRTFRKSRGGLWPPIPPPPPHSSGNLHFQQKMMIRSMTIEQYQYKSGSHKQYELFVLL